MVNLRRCSNRNSTWKTSFNNWSQTTLSCFQPTRLLWPSASDLGRRLTSAQPHLKGGSVYRQIRPTKLDKIENFHSLDSIATETYGTHGRSIRVHPS